MICIVNHRNIKLVVLFRDLSINSQYQSVDFVHFWPLPPLFMDSLFRNLHPIFIKHNCLENPKTYFKYSRNPPKNQNQPFWYCFNYLMYWSQNKCSPWVNYLTWNLMCHFFKNLPFPDFNVWRVKATATIVSILSYLWPLLVDLTSKHVNKQVCPLDIFTASP